MNGFLNIKEALDSYIKACQVKKDTPAWQIFIKGILAGLMIGIGAACSSVAGHSVSNVGLSRLAIAVVFPVGLMMVILLGAELFTGDCLAYLGVIDKKVKASFFWKLLLVVYFGNLVGAVIMAVLCWQSGQWNFSDGLLGAYNISVAINKMDISFMRGLCSGILCNVLVCATVIMAVCAKDVAGKLLASFFGVFIFAVSGYEHCVANMYYLTAGMLSKLNPHYVEVAKESLGVTAERLELLSLGGYITNLIPVTIGNLIGGAVFVGAALYYANKKKD